MLEIRNIQKSFESQIGSHSESRETSQSSIERPLGRQMVLSNISLTVGKGEFFSLLGPSGCGKSTLLRILAGLESADAGEILWKGKPLAAIPARLRPFNMVFQKYALFPHLTVAENIAFSLKLQNLKGSEIEMRVKEVLDLVNLQGMGLRLPETLSGGQAQRVALARALVNRPECVLLDEPLSALDKKLRDHMQTELRVLQKKLGLTFIFVTHDQEEAMTISDRVAVMNKGVLEQVASPRELYENPQSLFCARFIGRRNELSGQAKQTQTDYIEVELEGCSQGKQKFVGRFIPSQENQQVQADCKGSVQFFVRPERLRPLQENEKATDGLNLITGKVSEILFRGAQSELLLTLENDKTIFVPWDNSDKIPLTGQPLRVQFSPNDTHIYTVTH